VIAAAKEKLQALERAEIPRRRDGQPDLFRRAGTGCGAPRASGTGTTARARAGCTDPRRRWNGCTGYGASSTAGAATEASVVMAVRAVHVAVCDFLGGGLAHRGDGALEMQCPCRPAGGLPSTTTLSSAMSVTV